MGLRVQNVEFTDQGLAFRLQCPGLGVYMGLGSITIAEGIVLGVV